MSIQLFHFCLPMALVVTVSFQPLVVTAQTSPSAEEKSAAEAAKIQAEVRKIDSDTAKQQLELRKTQLEMAKSTATVEGKLIENNIAATKAMGCAGVDIATRLVRFAGNDEIYLFLYNSDVVSNLSVYSSLRHQNAYSIAELPKATAAFQRKLDEITAKLRPELFRKAEPSSTNFGLDRSKEFNPRTNIVGPKSTALTTGLGVIGGLANPFGAIVSAGLGLLSLAKTDTQYVGNSFEPVEMEMIGYLSSALRTKKVILFDPSQIIPEVGSDSPLLTELQTLSSLYNTAMRAIDQAAAHRKEITRLAQQVNDIDGRRLDVKRSELAVDLALKAYAEKDNEVNRARYKQAVSVLNRAKAQLENALGEVAKRESEFDRQLVQELSALNSHLARVDSLAKQLAINGETKGGFLFDQLRTEALYKLWNRHDKKASAVRPARPRSYWFQFKVSASGANQSKRSNIITDIFTLGPVIKYRGGVVAAYQVRELSGRLADSASVWAYTPYEKTKSMMKYECRGTLNEGALYEQWRRP
ncbi:MAG: hypothetical protein ABR530_06535 [Pyrinomonadaceae bacterium]